MGVNIAWSSDYNINHGDGGSCIKCYLFVQLVKDNYEALVKIENCGKTIVKYYPFRFPHDGRMPCDIFEIERDKIPVKYWGYYVSYDKPNENMKELIPGGVDETKIPLMPDYNLGLSGKYRITYTPGSFFENNGNNFEVKSNTVKLNIKGIKVSKSRSESIKTRMLELQKLFKAELPVGTSITNIKKLLKQQNISYSHIKDYRFKNDNVIIADIDDIDQKYDIRNTLKITIHLDGKNKLGYYELEIQE
jgi:hypothetical protein